MERGDSVRFRFCRLRCNSMKAKEEPLFRMNFSLSRSVSLPLTRTHTHHHTRSHVLVCAHAFANTPGLYLTLLPKQSKNILSGSVLFIEPIRKYSTLRDSRMSGCFQLEIAKAERSESENNRTGSKESFFAGGSSVLCPIASFGYSNCK